jgi:hypothetical protein
MSGRFTRLTTWKQIGQPCRLMIDLQAQNTRARNSACQITTIDAIATLKVTRKRIANIRSSLFVAMAVRVC